MRRHGLITKTLTVADIRLETIDKTGKIKEEKKTVIFNRKDESKLREKERKKLVEEEKLLVSFEILKTECGIYGQTPENFLKNAIKLK